MHGPQEPAFPQGAEVEALGGPRDGDTGRVVGVTVDGCPTVQWSDGEVGVFSAKGERDNPPRRIRLKA